MNPKGVKEIIKFLQHDYRGQLSKSQYEQLTYLKGVEYYGVHTLRKLFSISISVCAFPECEYCHKPITTIDELTIDHTIPRCHGGTDDIKNLQPMHGKCNSAKGCSIPTVIISDEQNVSLTKPKRAKRRPFKKPIRNQNISGHDVDDLKQKCERADSIYGHRVAIMRHGKTR